MNVSQALEYERQPFIPMFIYGDHGAMESERQKGEEALKVLETEYFTAEGDPSFDFATVRDLADRNRDLCDQIGEARLRNVTPATLSRGLSDADTCAAIGKMQKRTAASVMREIRGDRDALGVAYARKPIQGTVLGIDIETTGLKVDREAITEIGAVVLKDGQVTDRFQTFVNPGRRLTPEIIGLTGITDEMLKDAPELKEALTAFLASDSFEDALRRAVSLGGDTDTLAAISGSLAEPYFGIPASIYKIAEEYFTEEMKTVLQRFDALCEKEKD